MLCMTAKGTGGLRRRPAQNTTKNVSSRHPKLYESGVHLLYVVLVIAEGIIVSVESEVREDGKESDEVVDTCVPCLTVHQTKVASRTRVPWPMAH